MTSNPLLTPSSLCERLTALQVELDRLQAIQAAGYLPGATARALATSITRLEEAIMWLSKVGSHGFPVPDDAS